MYIICYLHLGLFKEQLLMHNNRTINPIAPIEISGNIVVVITRNLGSKYERIFIGFYAPDVF
jgi:hypothetical protein